MWILTLFCWMFTAIMWLVCAMAKFDKDTRPMFWAGLYVFAVGILPLFAD